MLAVSTMLSPTLLVSPLRTTGAPLLRTSAPVRVPSLRMDGKGSWVNGKWIAKGDAAYWMSPSLTGAVATSAASVLDTTPKFEEIATAAATQGSAAAAEGFEPGTCDPYDPKSAEFCSPTVEEDAPFLSKRTLKLGVLFFLWYALNTAYNIGNKLVLTALPIPWTSATIELFFGLPYVGMLWLTGLRKKPKLSLDNIKTLAPSAFFLSATHVGGVISFGAGAISFTHVLKATEPVWTVLLSAVFFREFLPWQIYASLIPIVGGVGLASLKEVSFSWLSFIAGTGSAVTSASKAILSKKVLDGKPLGENLTPANMFAVLTILGCFMLLPFSLAIEGPKTVQTAWVAARAAGYTASRLWTLLGVSGFLYYIYNEVAFLALSEVAPVTHAVTNTVKRVVIILASILVFRTPITLLGSIGSGLAILGALLYSLAKGKYK